MTNPNEPITTVCSEVLGQTIYQGLSIREHMAIEFTKALLSNSNMIFGSSDDQCSDAINQAIWCEDNLIKKLNETS